VNPSDRELEAKLVEMIRRYSFIRTAAGQQLYQFFVDIYEHFFDNEKSDAYDDTNDTNTNTNTSTSTEGFATMGTTNDNTNSTNNTDNTDNTDNTNSTNNTNDNTVSLIQQLDFTAGKLNPILKETYKRTISIDSQYRDPEYPMSTDFTLNFTETLRDVVSLKLYAIQLPVTWYTINENYGSNFFYLKSATPGIDTPDHEYRVEVSAGNYTASTLQQAISTSFNQLRTQYADVDFGTTDIAYNTSDCKATLSIDLQKAYNEHYYGLNFEKDPSTAGSLAGMLGFSNKTYDVLYQAFSTPTTPPSSAANAKTYIVDAATPGFSIVQYRSDIYTNPSLPKSLTTTKTYTNVALEYEDYQNITPNSQTIMLGLSYEIIDTIPITFPVEFYGNHDPTEIMEEVDRLLKAHSKLDNAVNASQVTYNEEKQQYVWSVKLDRFQNANTPNYKVVLRFPYTDDINRNLWIDTSNSSPSVFGWEPTTNTLPNDAKEAIVEMSNLVAENEKTSQLETIDNKIRWVCSNPNINPQIGAYDASMANYELPAINPNFDFEVDISNSNNYVQSTLTEEINTKIRSTAQDISDQLLDATEVRLENNQFFLKTDLRKRFTTEDFLTQQHTSNKSGPITSFGDFFSAPSGNESNNHFNMTVMGFDETTYIYTSEFKTQQDYEITPQTLFTIQGGDKFKDISFNPTIDTSGSFNRNDFISKINDILNNYQFDSTTTNYPLRNSSFTFFAIDGVTSHVELRIVVDFEITEKEYRLEFIDPAYVTTQPTQTTQTSLWETTVWNNAFGLDPSYNLSDYNTTTTPPLVSFIEISGNSVELDEQDISENIILKPNVNALNGVYVANSTVNDIVIPINAKNTTRLNLITVINEELRTNELTKGSYIELITDPQTQKSRTNIRWNVNKIYTTQDYRLVFYDIYSFVRCNESTRSYRNATIDNTLGWILGYRSLSEYPLIADNLMSVSRTYQNPDTLLSTGSPYTYSETFVDGHIINPNTVTTTLTGDTTVSVNLYNYFMIILDDFNQNHLNDGLVTVTKRDNSVTLPSYANRKKYQCDPVTGEIINSGIPTGQNNLTQNQLYSLNQIINTQNQNRGAVNSGPFVKDMFALIPVKTSGMTPGSIFVEFGGTLQNQERMYFGPVNINRLNVKLINDRGDTVDLNGANWSIQLVCEQLYQKQKGGGP
jgi:hypothetical protein